MGILSSSMSQEHKVCSKCLRRGTFLQPVLQCVRCQFYLCAHCSKLVAPDQRVIQWPFPFRLRPFRQLRCCCFSCSSSLLSLDDNILQYIMLFLTYKNQDCLLRVCTKFQTVLFLPYNYTKNIEERYLWKDPYDILYASRRSIVLRGLNRATGERHALKLIPKSQMLSRRMWQRLQQYIDIRMAASSFSPFFAAVHDVFQTHDFIVLVMELFPPELYQPLSTLILEVRLSEAECQRVITRVFEAVHYLHDGLHVAHRELSLDAIFVARDNFEDVRVLRFSNSRFLHPSSQSSYLNEMIRRNQQRILTEGMSCDGIENNGCMDTRSDFSLHTINTPEVAASGELATNTAPSAQVLAARFAAKPPRLRIPVNFALLRRAEMYARVARDREAQLHAAATRSKGFSRDTFRGVRQGKAPLSPIVSTKSAPVPQLSRMKLSPDAALDNVQIVATPRAAPGYAAPEQCASLCAISVVPSLASRAGDVKKSDVFAIGGIFYRLLSAALVDKGKGECAEWEELSSESSDESIVLLLRLMHVEPRGRASCREALDLLAAVSHS